MGRYPEHNVLWLRSSPVSVRLLHIYAGTHCSSIVSMKPKRRLVKAELLQLKLIHLFASELLLMKKLEIEKTKPTFIISVLKVEY